MNASSFSGWSGSWDSVPAALVSSAMDLNLSRIQPVRVGRRMHAMCGILTFISSRGDAAGYRQAVSDALESLHHRGPDHTGVEVFGRDAIFAHKRLSIIDVAGSPQAPPPAAGRAPAPHHGAVHNNTEPPRGVITE